MACGVPFTAGAVVVINSSASTTVFSDNFESGSFSPSVGSWSIGPNVSVVSSGSLPIPGAFEGSRYAEAFRDSNLNNQGNLVAQFSGIQSNPGDVVELSMMVYLPSATDVNVRGQFMITSGDFTTARAWARPDGAGHVVAVGPGISLTDTGLSYHTDVWERWDLRYSIGSSTFDVRVNGVLATGFSSLSTGAVDRAILFNGNNTPAGSLYLDAAAVPEPADYAVLSGLALIGFAVWSRRQR